MQLTANQLAQLLVNSGGLRQDWINAKPTSNTKQAQAWYDFGWPETLEFCDYFQMFERSGVADCIVTKPPKVCWKSHPFIYEGKTADDAATRKAPTAFEKSAEELSDRLSLFEAMKQADEKGRVGFYSALIIQVAGSGDEIVWDKPLGKIRPEQLVKLIPVYSEQLEVSTWDSNRASLRYGQPETYNYQESAVGDNRDSIKRTETIHHSRVIVFTEKPISESISGKPILKSSFNDLLMIELICGAGGQGFWKNAAGKLVFNIKDPQAAPVTDEEKTAMDEAIADFAEQLDKSLTVGGIDVTQLAAALDNPEPFYNMYISNIAAATGIPQNILKGSQTGVLAGDKDNEAFLSEMMSRRMNWCVSMVNKFVDWCIVHGVLPKVRYGVEFDDLLAASDEQKLTLADKMTTANDRHIGAQIKAGATEVMPLFSDEEIRLMAGYKAPVTIKVEQVEDEPDEPEDEMVE